MNFYLESGILGNTIRKARLAKHLSQEELAEHLEVTPTHIKHIESGHRRPSIDLLFRICRLLNVSIDALIFPENNKSNDTRSKIDRRLGECSDKQLRVILTTLEAIINSGLK